MKKIHFPHHTSLHHARQSQRLVEMRVAECGEKLRLAKAELEQLYECLERLRADCLANWNRQSGGAISAQVAIDASEQRIEQLRGIVRQCEHQWLEAQAQLVEARKQTEMLEQLLSDHQQLYQRQLQRHAQQELNDWTLRVHRHRA